MSTRAAPFALAAAFGPKLFGIAGKLMKSAKVVKLGLAGASVVSYAWLFTWEFAGLILFSLVVHEYGHVWAMRSVGIPTKGFYLIPFVGGAAVPERAFRSRLEEQYVAMMGPVFGLSQAALFYFAFVVSDYALFGAVAGWVAFLNLFNLLPISPLDGGRILKSATFSAGTRLGLISLALGLIGAVLLMAVMQFWLLGLIVVFSFMEFAWETRAARYSLDFYTKRMNRDQMLRCIALYGMVALGFVFILVGTLAVPEARLALSLLQDG